MLVTVKVLGGAEHTLDVAADTPIIRVKQVLAATISEPTANQRLIFKGKALADDRPLKFYNITDGSKLNLVVKPVTPATSGSVPTSSASVAATTSSTAASSSTSQARESGTRSHFQLLLQKFLQQHFREDDVTKLMDEINKSIHDLVYNLNLDDIENIAERNLK